MRGDTVHRAVGCKYCGGVLIKRPLDEVAKELWVCGGCGHGEVWLHTPVDFIIINLDLKIENDDSPGEQEAEAKSSASDENVAAQEGLGSSG